MKRGRPLRRPGGDVIPVRMVTIEQAARLYDALYPHVNYLFRLKERMERRQLIE